MLPVALVPGVYAEARSTLVSPSLASDSVKLGFSPVPLLTSWAGHSLLWKPVLYIRCLATSLASTP